MASLLVFPLDSSANPAGAQGTLAPPLGHLAPHSEGLSVKWLFTTEGVVPVEVPGASVTG
jgi:hypothetical protein